jgi:cyclic pyranopterin phosphate synthase
MIDKQGRSIEYLRLSVTPQCNLKCIYCNPADSDCCLTLNPAQIEIIVRQMVKLGIHKVRLTGGEPLMRADLEEIIARLSAIDGITDLPLTTNGVGLESRISSLSQAGVTRFNISLDSLDREKYKKITGADVFPTVMSAIDKALQMNIPVKLNAVLMRGVNDDDIGGFIGLARQYPLDIRFIELMPIGGYGEANRDQVMTREEILEAHPDLVFVGEGSGGVAQMYTAPGFCGRVGFISPISHQFCNTCNRVRMTAEGTIKPCLGDNGEVALAPFLNDEEALYHVIREAIFNKPKGHCFKEAYQSVRDMKRIGG